MERLAAPDTFACAISGPATAAISEHIASRNLGRGAATLAPAEAGAPAAT